MKFLEIDDTTTLSDISSRVGRRNVGTLLNVNDLSRSRDIGKQYSKLCSNIYSNNATVDWQRKASILSSMSQDSDVFEHASLQGEDSWKVLSAIGSFPGMLKIPDSIDVSDSVDILGNSTTTSKTIYTSVMKQIQTYPHRIDPSTFNEISTIKSSALSGAGGSSSKNVFEAFRVPWRDISLFSSMSNEMVDFPVYPETVEDGSAASYSQMPDMLYQYEPWSVYSSSGPRNVTYEFHMHRDMWTGNHQDGMCNNLIRFCQAQCYAKYQGAAVDTSLVTLYVKGNNVITGIMQNAKVSWSGPIGLDGWYLECTLSITIQEVSKQALSYDVVRNKTLLS